MHPASRLLMFDTFRFNSQSRELLRVGNEGPATAIPLGSRAADLLLLFLQRPGDLITKNEIMDAVWPKAAMEESNLTVQISALRRALDADRSGASSIQTVPGRGYRFTLPVTFGDAVERDDASPGGDGVDIAAGVDEIVQAASKSSAESMDIGEPEPKNTPALFHSIEVAPGAQERLLGKIGSAERLVAAPARTWAIVVSAASAAALTAAVAFYLAAMPPGRPVAPLVRTPVATEASAGSQLNGINLPGGGLFQLMA